MNIPETKSETVSSGDMHSQFILLMGVSGSGKTTVGTALAQRAGWDFYDGDDFHPPENVAKMAGGIPLTDEDRAPWLEALHGLIASCLEAELPAVLACSALKERYRQRLLADTRGVQIVYLKGSYRLFRSRLTTRSGHYMKSDLLHSQFEALEEPSGALVIDASQSVRKIVAEIVKKAMGIGQDGPNPMG